MRFTGVWRKPVFPFSHRYLTGSGTRFPRVWRKPVFSFSQRCPKDGGARFPHVWALLSFIDIARRRLS